MNDKTLEEIQQDKDTLIGELLWLMHDCDTLLGVFSDESTDDEKDAAMSNVRSQIASYRREWAYELESWKKERLSND